MTSLQLYVNMYLLNQLTIFQKKGQKQWLQRKQMKQ
nr:MAG TPA: hypothetical protein [Caudoviricetes sp.]